MPAPEADFRLLHLAGRPYLVPVRTTAEDGPSVFSPTDSLDPYRTSATVLAETEAAEPDGGTCDADLHCGTMEVPNALVGALIGRGGETLTRLQRDTAATLHLPRGPRRWARRRGRGRARRIDDGADVGAVGGGARGDAVARLRAPRRCARATRAQIVLQ